MVVYAKNNLIRKVKLSTDGGLGLNVTSVNEPTLGGKFFSKYLRKPRFLGDIRSSPIGSIINFYL